MEDINVKRYWSEVHNELGTFMLRSATIREAYDTDTVEGNRFASEVYEGRSFDEELDLFWVVYRVNEMLDNDINSNTHLSRVGGVAYADDADAATRVFV